MSHYGSSFGKVLRFFAQANSVFQKPCQSHFELSDPNVSKGHEGDGKSENPPRITTSRGIFKSHLERRPDDISRTIKTDQ